MGRPVVTAFGKLRVEGEFLGFADGEPQISFAQWLDEGIGYAVERGGVMWRDLFQDCGPQAFIYRAPARAQAKSVLLGVLGPSEDWFSRPFPFAVMTELHEASFAGSGSALPIAAERFVAEAAEVCRLAPSAKRASDVLSRAQEVRAPGIEECTAAAQDLADWQTTEGTLARIWPALFSDARRAESCFERLVDTVAPMRTHGAIGTCRALRLPLGGGGAAAASFWLDVVRSLAQCPIPAVFWPADRATGSVLVQLGEVPDASFAQLWGSGVPDPSLVDLSSGSGLQTSPDVPALPTDLRRIFGDPRARGRSLIDALGRVP